MVYPELAESLYLALADDPFYIQLEQQIVDSGLDGRLGMLGYYDCSIRVAEETGILTLPNQPANWGAALWSVPSTDSAQLTFNKSDYMSNSLGSQAYQHYQAVCHSMASLSAPHISDSYWYLSIIGITTTMQGKGLGQQLIEPVLQQADDAGVCTYLETFVPRNISFYQRYGYTRVAELNESVMGASYHLLVRPPGG